MGFLYRLGLAVLCSIALALFTMVWLGQPVTPRCFYGAIAFAVFLSYADDWRARRVFHREAGRMMGRSR